MPARVKRKVGGGCALLWLAMSLAGGRQVHGQQPPPLWAGWARCEVTVQGPGYSDQQTHTWTITGGAPTVQGAFRVYPGTWTVVGGGSLQRTQGSQTLTAQWATNGQSASAPLAVFVRASDGRMFMQARHAQLRAPGAIAGYQQVTVDGVPQTPGSIAAEAFEASFPVVDGTATSSTLSGSRTIPVNGSVGLMQPGGSTAGAACTWQFGQGSAAPAPAPVLSARAVPTPAAPGGAAPPASSPAAPASSAAPGAAAAPPAPVLPPAPATATTPPVSHAGAPPVATQPPGPVAAQPATVPPQQAGNRPPIGTLPTTSPGGFTSVPGGTAPPVTGPGPTAATALDPANFTAVQSADGVVLLTWDAVAGAGSYLVGGPGTGVGVTVNGLSHTVTGVPQGSQTWTVATMYNPGGILTTSDRWSRATATVVNRTGRYRILMTGFRITHDTGDDPVRNDGQHDEVYPSAVVSLLDRQLQPMQAAVVVVGATYGDNARHPTRVRAGSVSSTGGLTSGDVVPSGTNPAAPGLPPSATGFPLQLWEGNLSDGAEVVVVRPVLWESDGDTSMFAAWRNRSGAVDLVERPGGPSDRSKIEAKVASRDLSQAKGTMQEYCTNVADFLTLVQTPCRPGLDRAIGVHWETCNDGTVETVYGQPRFCQPIVVLTREAAEAALSGQSQVGGMPPGGLQVHLQEAGAGFSADYDLYLAIQRVP